MKSGMTEEYAENVCSTFGSCRPKAVSLSLKTKPQVSFATLLSDQSACDYCKNVVDYLTGDGAPDFSIPILYKFVKEVCVTMPPVQSFCDSLTPHHVEKMISVIYNHFEITEICGAAGLCH